MHDSFKRLQIEYIDELRRVVEQVLRWWADRCPYPHTDPRSYEEMHPFHRRWLAGPAGHPRVIAVFRDYYFKVQSINDAADAVDRETSAPAVNDQEQSWGRDVAPAWVPLAKPLDVLVNDLASKAPDLYEVMQGFVFVPIGMDPYQEEC